MLAKIHSGAVYGVDAYPVEIEVDAADKGDPQTVIVGLPDTAVKESKDRVFTALTNSNFITPKGRVTVNLAPADIKKEGPLFDLPIAIGVLATQGDVPEEALAGVGMVGELALSGEVRRVRGVLPIVMAMRDKGLARILVPSDNADEAAVVENVEVYPVRSLDHAVGVLSGTAGDSPYKVRIDRIFEKHSCCEDDFGDIKGQEQAKRAIEVAVAGGHNVLMVGPPGTGKTMLAKRIPSILPLMTLDEALDTTRIHSVAGALQSRQALVVQRPFRSPHHTVSDAGLLGGGAHPIPGEVSLAHGGVLFLDELPEFRRNVLEVLRQPLEDGIVTISRAVGSITFPCRFMLVAAMNPCACGYWGDPRRECRCTPPQIQRYRNRISGPLLDRIDIHIEVPGIRYHELAAAGTSEPSAAVRDRILAAREIQRNRFGSSLKASGRRKKVYDNSAMRPKDLQQFCRLQPESRDLLKMAVTDLNFSARAYDRILKVSRTIADLEQVEDIRPQHVSEAIQYRLLDRQAWG